MPSCTPCNVGASNDDEYFKTAMIIKDRAGSHPEAVTIRSSVFRGLALPKKEGFRRHILRNTGFVSLNTPAGLYLGHKPALNVDLRRLDRVVARVTKGLYWHHHNHARLPDDHDVTVWSQDGLRGIGLVEAARVERQLVAPTLNNPAHTLGRGVLRYWYAASDRQHVTAWIHEFYDDVRFLAITVPNAA